jgi:oligoribonuclease
VLVWMDLEMTGLDHTRDRIVEIATIITDDDLAVVEEGPDLVIHAPDDVIAAMAPVVVDMHTRSGLIEAIRASTVTVEEAGAVTLEFIRRHVPDARSVPLCGNSIGTDRRFLARWLPAIEEFLHYRSVDVSSVKELVKRWYPELTPRFPHKAGTHRALDDIRSSIEELRFYRDAVFVPRAPAPTPVAG